MKEEKIMAEKNYTVTGMSCAACANAVEKALNKNNRYFEKVLCIYLCNLLI